MDPTTAALVVLAGAGLGFIVLAERRQRRRDGSLAPVSTVAAAPPGAFVRLVGTIVEGDPVKAPITGRTCVGFSATLHPVVVEVPAAAVNESRRWREATSRVGSGAFVVDDGTGRVSVEPGGLRIRVAVDHHAVVREREPVELHDPSMLPPGVAYDELVLDEGILTIGSRVVLEGIVRRGGDASDGAVFRASAAPATLTASRDRAAGVSNLPANLEEATEKLRLAKRAE